MWKRLQVISLAVLCVCSGISISSGLYFFEIQESIYVLYVLCMMLLYYCARHFLGERKHREGYALLLTLVVLFLCMVVLRQSLYAGFAGLWNSLTNAFQKISGVSFVTLADADKDYVGLAICQIVALNTAVSLALFESSKPPVIVSMPSFVLFFLSIALDGVPYESCTITFGMTFLVFLGMGRYQGRVETVEKFLFMLVCVAGVSLFAWNAFSWGEIEPTIKEYREKVPLGDRIIQETGDGAEREKQDRQTIYYGQFSRQGSITYRDTLELKVLLSAPFMQQRLFLRGFVGEQFENNIWYGATMVNCFDRYGNAFELPYMIQVQSVYDTAAYVPCGMDEADLEALQECKIHNPKTISVDPTLLQVDKKLKQRIRKDIIRETSFETIFDVTQFLEHLYDENYIYTLHPGKYDGERDEVTTFLFERKTGYCTHFASSAVMIFRTLGVPARIAQGYMMSGYKLKVGEENEIYDRNAHAWVEIYVEEYGGWVPIDVTPTSGTTAARRRLSTQNKNKVTPKRTKKPNQKQDSLGKKGGLEAVRFETRIVIRLALICAGMAGVLSVFAAWNRRRQFIRLKKDMQQANRSLRLLCLNDNMEKVWKRIGVFWSYDDSDQLTEDILHATLRFYVFGESEETRVLRDKIRTYVISVYRSRYGKRDITEEEYEFCLNYVTDLLNHVKEQVTKNAWKKLSKQHIVRLLCEKGKENGSK